MFTTLQISRTREGWKTRVAKVCKVLHLFSDAQQERGPLVSPVSICNVFNDLSVQDWGLEIWKVPFLVTNVPIHDYEHRALTRWSRGEATGGRGVPRFCGEDAGWQTKANKSADRTGEAAARSLCLRLCQDRGVLVLAGKVCGSQLGS